MSKFRKCCFTVSVRSWAGKVEERVGSEKEQKCFWEGAYRDWNDPTVGPG